MCGTATLHYNLSHYYTIIDCSKEKIVSEILVFDNESLNKERIF